MRIQRFSLHEPPSTRPRRNSRLKLLNRTVDADHNVTALGTYSTMDGGEVPAWLMNAGECTKWL